MSDLTPKQRIFALEYLVDLNATQAAIRAGYSKKTAEVQGSRLLSNAKVKAFVEEALSKRTEGLGLKADDVLLELKRVALADIGQAFDEHGSLKPIKDIPEDVRRAIAGIEVDELWEGFGEERTQTGVAKKVKFWSKPETLNMLGKYFKLFTEKVEHSGTIAVSGVVMMPPEDPNG